MKPILIIEDDCQTADNLEILLEMEGFKVLRAEDGRQGLAMALQSRPSLVICDVGLPQLDGYGVLQALRQAPGGHDIPFVFLTARGEKQDHRAGMNLGADDYLCKPIEAEDLLAAIRSRLNRQRLSKEATLRDAQVAPDFSSPKPLETLGLTPREAEVLLWVAQGKGNGDVATILGMSEKTVKIHVHHIFDKLNVETRTAAALAALEILAKVLPTPPSA